MSIFAKLPQSIVYFSKIFGTPIYDEKRKKLGCLKDFFVDFEDIYPAVIGIQFTHHQTIFYAAWDAIELFSYQAIILKDIQKIRVGDFFPFNYKEQRPPRHLLSYKNKDRTVNYPGIAKVVLDKQIVDTHGKKVVRVNDLHFIKVGQQLRVTYASIGIHGMLRRLGFDQVVNPIMNFMNTKSTWGQKETVISWKFVHAVPDRGLQKHLQLNISNEDLSQIHPADLADILEDLDKHGREQIFSTLDPETQAKALSELEEDMQMALIQKTKFTPEIIAQIIENMGSDEAADILKKLSHETAKRIIAAIKDDEVQEDIQDLLDYQDDTAGGIMSTEAFEVSLEDTKESILNKIADQYEDLESIYDLYVVDSEEHLIGTCSLLELLGHKENIHVKEIMETKDIKFLHPGDSWKTVALCMSKYNLITVPILDPDKKLLGIVSVDDILPWLLDE